MLLPQTAEYALRAMAYMAIIPKGSQVRAKDLSEKTFIPVHYLSKIMRHMVTAGLVDSQRGHGGGFVLTRAPASIRFLDVLSAVGYKFASDQCVFGWGTCNAFQPCPLHTSWSELSVAFLQWASQTTLADVSPSSKLI